MSLSSLMPAARLRLTRSLALGLALTLTVLAHLGAEKLALLYAIEFSFRDSVQQMFARPQASEHVALVDIDEESLKRLGAWPWSRAQIADLAQATLNQGARLVVLDMVFPEPRDRQGDARLLALATQRQVVLSQVFDYVSRPIANQTGVPAGATAGNEPAGPGATGLGALNAAAAVPAFGYIANHAGLEQAPCVGNIGFAPDQDGKLRRLALLTRWQEGLYPALSLAAIDCAGTPLASSSRPPSGQLVLRMQRTDESWSMLPAYALFDTQGAPLAQGLLKDKIVLIGSSALGLSDRVATALSPSTSGMLVHAHAIEQLLGPSPAAPVPGWAVLAAGLTLLALIGWLLIGLLSLKLALALTALGLTLWVGFITREALLGSAAFLTAPLSGLIALAAFFVPSELSRARREARATINLLSRYVARPVLQELLRSGNFDPLRLRHAEITVVVVDMVDYSKAIAGLDLQASAAMTRGFLECLTEPVWSSRGTLDRYTGDGLVAFWGAPLAQPDHASQALWAVKAMHERLEKLNASLRAQGVAALKVRVGIASGLAMVGDLGTHYRATYTAVGDCINTAARLENKAKELHCAVLANEAFAKSVQPEDCQALGVHELRGIGAVAIYSVAMGEATLLPSEGL